MGQLSFYSAEARQPCVGDLAGLLCGPGRALGFARGRAARVSVTVDTRDRAVAVAAALAERGVQARVELVRTPVLVEAAEDEPVPADEPGAAEPAEPEAVADEDVPDEDVPDEPLDDVVDLPVDDEPDGFAPVVIGAGRSRPAEPVAEPAEPDTGPTWPVADEPVEDEPVVTESWQVTTAFRTDLAGLAAQWLDGDGKVVPPDFTLDGAALRLWALASGRWVESGSGYLLGLDPDAPDTHEPLRKALATSGLPSTLLTGKAGGPALRVAGRRRLERLAELVGRAPTGVAERTWPAA
ncbi:hypothetical protein LZG04_33025 [Saccharothrix sp. S26]|uniref:hypothetical protein n=1 Tax=Saccharothrix sp. S26 TaxID=2907215 RepID=UPI001F433FF0|nr:hypothetical protein [Saccharothrix sp. S26]MCE6999601.1 hypothetical protein [Saccharothrix sp. S26]